MDLNKLLNPRLVELMEADEEGRIVVLPTKVDEQKFCVERALNIRLFDWQVAYIWGNSSYMMPGRATGKTLAQIIKMCVSKGCPIILPVNRVPNLDGLGFTEYCHQYSVFRQEVMAAYRTLELCQVPGLRKIYFSDEEARANGFNPWRY